MARGVRKCVSNGKRRRRARAGQASTRQWFGGHGLRMGIWNSATSSPMRGQKALTSAKTSGGEPDAACIGGDEESELLSRLAARVAPGQKCTCPKRPGLVTVV